MSKSLMMLRQAAHPRLWIGALAATLAVSACDVGTPPVPTPHTLPGAADYAKGFPSQSEDPTPLALAVIMDEASRVEALLASGADPNARWGGRGDRFPLVDAIIGESYGFPSRSRDTIVRTLLAHGADPNARYCPFESRQSITPTNPGCTSDHGFTPLMAAVQRDQSNVVYRLLDAGARSLDRNWMDGTALDLAESDLMFVLLLHATFPGADAERRAARELLARLHLTAEELLASLTDIRVGGYYLASSYGRIRLTLAGLDSSTAARQRSQAGLNQLLKWALNEQDAERILLLLAAGAAPDVRTCGAGWKLAGGMPDSRCTSENGITILMFAAACGLPAVERAARERDADAALVDWNGWTPGDYARRKPLTCAASPEIVF